MAPLYVDQSRDVLDSEKSVFDEITGGQEELMLGKYVHWRARFVFLSFSSSRCA